MSEQPDPCHDNDTHGPQFFSRCNLFQLPMNRIVAHQGIGEILFHRIAVRENVDGGCNFIDFAEMPPGTTIGRHTHRADEEEYYLVLSGQGRMECNGESFEVGPGELVRNRPGGTHALENTGEEILRIFVFEMAVR